MQSYAPQQAVSLGTVQRDSVPKTEQNVSNPIFIGVKSPESMNHALFPFKMSFLDRLKKLVFFIRGHHLAPLSFHISSGGTNQTLALERGFCTGKWGDEGVSVGCNLHQTLQARLSV